MSRRPTCPDCGALMVDEGIGSYEFWGQRCVDTNWVCEACEAAADEPTTDPDEESPDDQ